MYDGLLTELEAVNAMLTGISEQPVNTLEDEGVTEMVLARQTLREVSRSVQSAGWHFNTVRNLVLHPSVPEKEIVLPHNCLRVDTVRRSADIDVVQRGQKLFNASRNTLSFDHPVSVDLVLFLPFDELIQPARDLITIRATRRFQVKVVRSTTLPALTDREEYDALAVLKQAELQNADYNYLWHNPLSRYTVLRDRRV